MMDRDALLHVAIEATDNGLVTRVVTSPAGEASAPFVFPAAVTPQRLAASLAAAQSAEEAGDWDAAAQGMRNLGEQLFGALFAGPLAANLHESLQMAYQARGALHLRLSLPDRPDLLTVPWELIYDPTRQEHLARSPHAPFLRYIDRRHQIRPFAVQRPLRALVVIANVDNPRAEWIQLIDTLDYLGLENRLLLERLERPTLFALQRRLRQQTYHILHVIGRAVYNETARDGRLMIQDEVGQARMVSGPHLGQLLRDHYATRLAILESADETSDPRVPMGLLGYNMVPHGVPAAIVMPHRLPDKLRFAFLHDLYSAIADFTPVDLAVTAARNALVSEGPSVQWASPWLLARTVDGQIFDDGRRPPPKPEPGRREPSLLERVLRSGAGGDW